MSVPETSMFDVDGVGLEVRRWPGEGIPVLLLHEGLGSVSMWRDFPSQLAEASGRPVVAWSRRGYGGSEPLSGARSPDYMHAEARAVPPLLDTLGIERAILLGHSDGASIAIIAAAGFPDRVEALILEAPHVLVEDITLASIAAARDAFLTTDLAARLSRHHADAEAVFWRWNDIWLDPAFRSWNIEGLLPGIGAPALLIQGLDDEYGTLDQLERIAAILPATRRLELADCRHSPHRDRRDEVIAATTDFLRSLP